MTSVNAELFHREFDEKHAYVKCPACGARHKDLDGFGFLYCDICGECTHPSADGDAQGYFHCTVCGDCVGEPHETQQNTKPGEHP